MNVSRNDFCRNDSFAEVAEDSGPQKFLQIFRKCFLQALLQDFIQELLLQFFQEFRSQEFWSYAK